MLCYPIKKTVETVNLKYIGTYGKSDYRLLHWTLIEWNHSLYELSKA